MARMTVTRINDAFAFNAVDEAHNSMILDIPVDQGGHGTGLRPMQTLLSALGACSGVDIVMILNKQKETIEFFEMIIDGERETGKEPALWQTVHIVSLILFLNQWQNMFWLISVLLPLIFYFVIVLPYVLLFHTR